MLFKSRKGIQSDRYLKKRRKRSVLAAVLFIIAAGSVVAALSLFSKASFMQITSVNVTGTHLVPADAVGKMAETGLTGDWWGIFSRDSIFLYPKAAIRSQIEVSFPPVSSVSFSYDGLHVLNVTVDERSPFALTCPSDDDATSGPLYSGASQCFYIDSTGFVYAPAPQFSPGVYVVYTAASSSFSTPSSSIVAPGQYLTGAENFQTAVQAVSGFSALGLNVDNIFVPSDSDGDYEVFLKKPASAATAAVAPVTAVSALPPASTSPASFPTSSSDIAVYFNSSQPLETTLEYFNAFWQHETDKNFQYIDLRYGKDIVFKMQ